MSLKAKYLVLLSLVHNLAFNDVENKITNVNKLVKKKTDYNTNISENEKKITDHDHGEYITTPEFNKLTAETFVARLIQANLASKNDVAALVKKRQILMIN